MADEKDNLHGDSMHNSHGDKPYEGDINESDVTNSSSDEYEYDGGSSVDRYFGNDNDYHWDEDIEQSEFEQPDFNPNVASLSRDNDNVFNEEEIIGSRTYDDDYDYEPGFFGLPTWLVALLLALMIGVLAWALWFTQIRDHDQSSHNDSLGSTGVVDSSDSNTNSTDGGDVVLPSRTHIADSNKNDKSGNKSSEANKDDSTGGVGAEAKKKKEIAKKEVDIANSRVSKLKEDNAKLHKALEAEKSSARENSVTKTVTKERTITSRATNTVTRRITPEPRVVTETVPGRANTLTVTEPAPAPETVTETVPTTITKVERETIYRRIR